MPIGENPVPTITKIITHGTERVKRVDRVFVGEDGIRRRRRLRPTFFYLSAPRGLRHLAVLETADGDSGAGAVSRTYCQSVQFHVGKSWAND